MKKSILYFNFRQFDLALARLLLIGITFLGHRGKIIKRESRGINNFLRDQGSKFWFLVFVTVFQRIYMYRTIYCLLGLFGLFASTDVLKVTESQGDGV